MGERCTGRFPVANVDVGAEDFELSNWERSVSSGAVWVRFHLIISNRLTKKPSTGLVRVNLQWSQLFQPVWLCCMLQ